MWVEVGKSRFTNEKDRPQFSKYESEAFLLSPYSDSPSGFGAG